MWSDRTLDEWLDDLLSQVVAAVDPQAVWLFGSLARGDDTGDSDIDLLVVLEDTDPRSPVELRRAVRDLVTTPVPYDLAFSTRSKLTERSRIAGSIERAATRDGRALYERP